MHRQGNFITGFFPDAVQANLEEVREHEEEARSLLAKVEKHN